MSFSWKLLIYLLYVLRSPALKGSSVLTKIIIKSCLFFVSYKHDAIIYMWGSEPRTISIKLKFHIIDSSRYLPDRDVIPFVCQAQSGAHNPMIPLRHGPSPFGPEPRFTLFHCLIHFLGLLCRNSEEGSPPEVNNSAGKQESSALGPLAIPQWG